MTLYIINKGRKADFSSLSPIIIIEKSNLQTFLHSLNAPSVEFTLRVSKYFDRDSFYAHVIYSKLII